MNWDDLRFVLAVFRTGSLLAAGRELSVDHTTVGRRVEACERALGVRLFARTTTGLVPTEDAERLLGRMKDVEEAVLQVERNALAQQEGLGGVLRVTSPETFGTHYLAARLARFRGEHPALTVELLPAGRVFDLSRREADLAVRTVRSRTDGLVAKRGAQVTYGMYGAPRYLKRRALRGPEDLARHVVFSTPPGDDEVEHRWLHRLCPTAVPLLTSAVSAALLEAAVAGEGVAILPRYLGDADKRLRHVPMPEPPVETLWLTVHRDVRKTPRVRAVLDFLASTMAADAALFSGARR